MHYLKIHSNAFIQTTSAQFLILLVYYSTTCPQEIVFRKQYVWDYHPVGVSLLCDFSFRSQTLSLSNTWTYVAWCTLQMGLGHQQHCTAISNLKDAGHALWLISGKPRRKEMSFCRLVDSLKSLHRFRKRGKNTHGHLGPDIFP